MLRFGVDPDDLTQTGWGVLFSRQQEPAVREALRPLLDHRSDQAGALYRELEYDSPESAVGFLARHGAGPGPVDPGQLPFYLLLVGSPEAIPFYFQYQLSVTHAVGRVHFDRPEEYARYAEGVLAAEGRAPDPPRRSVFVAVQHPNDRVTELAAKELVEPLVADLGAHFSGWAIDLRTGPQAGKAALQQVLAEAPELLFVSAHGYRLHRGHERQEAYQGAIVCQDWPGPGESSVEEAHLLHADDIDREVDLGGALIFLLSSDGAGTPRHDDFYRSGGLDAEPQVLAERPFVNRLAQRLLSRGARAVIGHVDRTWTVSFRWTRNGRGLENGTFREVFGQLLRGRTVGWAMRPMVTRYLSLAAHLGELLHQRHAGEDVSEELIARVWTGQKDARNYIVLGDPAVHLWRDGS